MANKIVLDLVPIWNDKHKKSCNISIELCVVAFGRTFQAFETRYDRQSPEGSSVLVLSLLATIVNRQREAVYWCFLDSQRSLIVRGKQCTGAFLTRNDR